MNGKTLMGMAGVLMVLLLSASPVVAQEVTGQEHWVQHKDGQDEIKLYMWRKFVGSADGKKVVVLAHGSALGGRASFDLQVPGKKPTYSTMDYLAQEGFDVFAPDIRAFGRSTYPEKHTKIDQHYRDLKAVIDYIRKLRGVDKVGLLAWSYANQYGGMMVMRHPDMIDRYVIYAMHHLYSPDMANRRPSLERLQAKPYVDRKKEVWMPRLYKNLPKDTTDADVIEAYAEAGWQTQKRSNTGPDLERIVTVLPWISPKLMSVPTMVIHGQFDDQADLDGGIPFFLALANPYKKYVVVPNAGHFAHIQKGYDVLLREITSWFKGP